MPKRVVHLASEDFSVAGQTIRKRILEIQRELDLREQFPTEVEDAAKQAAENPRLPTLDRTDLPMVTIDPTGALDLDQALHLERNGDGFVVHYAIADVAAFVHPGDPVDQMASKRGETLYGADSKLPLHPKVLSEAAASLLPDQVNPALLWTLNLDAAGLTTEAKVERALVRSTAKLDYVGVQEQFDQNRVDPMLALLKEIGELLQAQEINRGGVSLPLPEQEVAVAQGHWTLVHRRQLPVEQWNAQISLLTGRAAASMMLQAGVGVLRTLPEANPRDLERLRQVASAVGVTWPRDMSYAEFIRTVDPASPTGAAVLVAAARTLRGAGYVAFNGNDPEHPTHAAIAAPYTHVTAPLRRLIDRYAGEICVAICAGEPIPNWVMAKLGELPDLMTESAHRASKYSHAVFDLVEAALLSQHLGATFPGVVVSISDHDPETGSLMLSKPPIEARVTGNPPLPLGQSVSARLVEANVDTRVVSFQLIRPDSVGDSGKHQ